MPDVADLKALRHFGLLMAAMLCALFGLLLPWLFGLRFPQWPWYAGAGFLSLALLWPRALAPVYRGWMRFGMIMNWINTRLLLGITFFAIITPMGLVARMMGRDALLRRFDAQASSYRISRQRKIVPEDLEKPY